MDENIPISDLFDQFNLKLELLRGIYTYNLEKPSQIQKLTLNELISNHDIIVKSKSGTGKTLSYIIYSLNKIDQKVKEVQCLVLTYTRDLALKIESEYNKISKFTQIKINAFIGGASIKDDIKKLSEGTQIIVGTPGRILDMLNRKIFSLSELKLFVLDDINEIFNRGFIENIKQIVSKIGENTQKAIFSSSEKNIENLEDLIKLNKNYVTVTNSNMSIKQLLENLKQYKISLKEEWKFEILMNLYKLMEISQVILFCKDKERSENLKNELNNNGFISSNLNEEDKERIISNFKSGYIRILICTNNESINEIDIYQDNLIINYDLPSKIEEFVRRIGRNESFSKKGIVVNFVTENDKEIINQIEENIKEKVEELPLELSIINEKK